MPQTNVIPDWKATYPNDAKAQKPSGISGTVSRTASAGSWAANVATLTVPATTDYVGTVYPITVAGFTPAGYNGTFQGTIASATTITYPLTTNPGGVATVMGTVSYPGIIPLNLSTTLGANAVPNKPTYATGTIQAYDPELGQMVLDKVAEKIKDLVDEKVEEVKAAKKEDNPKSGKSH
jgi:hypothetical protein